ncbi:MAG TPA: galactokinase family protein [Anaerolineae bacterium]
MLTHTLPPIGLARPEAERIEQLISCLERTYGANPATVRVVKVPLRICPLGAHIDHQLGRVTGMAIDRSVLMAFAPTNDGTVHVDSLEFSPAISFSLNQVPPYQRGDWGNYIRGAVLGLQDRFQLQQGLVGVIGGDMPIGGLSSSSAVTIAYLLALEAINNLAMPPEENVALVRFTENQYIGLNNGILDQTVILFSRLNHLTLIDCQSIQIDPIPTSLQTDEFDIMIVYSGVTQALMGTDYNNRVAECREAARLLLTYGGLEVGADSRLRRVPPDLFEAEGHRLPESLRRRATHYFGEMQRVIDGVTAWQAGDLNRFGRLISESGESSIKYYECGCPQLITLYELLRDTPGVFGVRFSGAGFRGNCIALVDPAAREAVAAAIQRRYPVAHPELAGAYRIDFCQSEDRAQLTPWRRL